MIYESELREKSINGDGNGPETPKGIVSIT